MNQGICIHVKHTYLHMCAYVHISTQFTHIACMLRCHNMLQHTATHCNTLQHTAIHCNTLQHTATRCNTLQHAALQCLPYILYQPSQNQVQYSQQMLDSNQGGGLHMQQHMQQHMQIGQQLGQYHHDYNINNNMHREASMHGNCGGGKGPAQRGADPNEIISRLSDLASAAPSHKDVKRQRDTDDAHDSHSFRGKHSSSLEVQVFEAPATMKPTTPASSTKKKSAKNPAAQTPAARRAGKTQKASSSPQEPSVDMMTCCVQLRAGKPLTAIHCNALQLPLVDMMTCCVQLRIYICIQNVCACVCVHVCVCVCFGCAYVRLCVCRHVCIYTYLSQYVVASGSIHE